MKSNLFKTAMIFLIGLLVLSGCGITTNPSPEPSETVSTDYEGNKITIVTSFYPMYIFTLNITKDIPGLKVVNLTSPDTGDLHDYALTPEDMKKLEGAQIMVINGVGLESFLDKAISQMPDLKVITASEGIDLLEDDSHNDDEDEHEANGDAHELNPHVWVSIANAITQVENIGKQLALLDPKHEEDYKRNTTEYIVQLEQQKQKMQQALSKIENRNIVTFHNAFPYFAQEFHLNIAGVVQSKPGSEPNAKELGEIITTVKNLNIKALFAEPQYPDNAAKIIANETSARVYTLDPVVTGPMEANAYINIMDSNLKTLLEALK